MRALILNGQIVDLAPVDFPVHESMQWIDAPAGATMESHVFSGGAVIPRPAPAAKTAAELAAEDSQAARAELVALDRASIRDIRAYIASQPDAPQLLKDREAAAVLLRARVI